MMSWQSDGRVTEYPCGGELPGTVVLVPRVPELDEETATIIS